jgi:hypothetical protein
LDYTVDKQEGYEELHLYDLLKYDENYFLILDYFFEQEAYSEKQDVILQQVLMHRYD